MFSRVIALSHVAEMKMKYFRLNEVDNWLKNKCAIFTSHDFLQNISSYFEIVDIILGLFKPYILHNELLCSMKSDHKTFKQMVRNSVTIVLL